MNKIKTVVIILFGITVSATFFLTGCETLKESKPIIPIKKYERMIIGRLDADYIGTQNCLATCHYHDQINQDFEGSTMGAQLSKESGMPLVDCESCHGPGSLAVEGLSPEKVKIEAMEGKKTECDYDTLIDIKNLPAQAQSLICLKCHTANATFNIHDWNTGIHNMNDVSCSNCHNIHEGPDLIVEPRDTFRMCSECHQDIDAQFTLPSHHPIHEERVFCTDCHDPHGVPVEKSLRGSSVKEVCTKCHSEKSGPFIYEHAELNDDCRNCHLPHGSANNNLLLASQPFLCLQCHTGHRAADGSSKRAFYTRCTDCHSAIHGTDIPGQSGTGRFTQ